MLIASLELRGEDGSLHDSMFVQAADGGGLDMEFDVPRSVRYVSLRFTIPKEEEDDAAGL